jgi:hypothetical protein
MKGNMKKTECILFWAQRYDDGTYHARAYDPSTGLASGVRAGESLESALEKAANCGQWFVVEWRDEVPDGEQYRLVPAKNSTAEIAKRIAYRPAQAISQPNAQSCGTE